MVPYDPRIGATLSSHELAQGYQDTEDPSITVRFRVAGEENTSILVWTTTPWTLPSNLALAVGEAIDYSYCRVEAETLIVAEALREAVMRDLEHEVIKTVKGSELVGTRYEKVWKAACQPEPPELKSQHEVTDWQANHPSCSYTWEPE